jgi:hypothetical protein
MQKTSSNRPRQNNLILTQHARERLGSRGLWPALGHIARIAHHDLSPRYRDLSNDGRPVERIEADGFVIVVAHDPNGERLTLLTVHSADEIGARACTRIISYSRSLSHGVRS